MKTTVMKTTAPFPTAFFPAALFVMTLLITLLGPAAPVRSQDLSDADMIDYLTQSICVDLTGKPTDALPIGEDCLYRRPQRSDDTATYRKHDWPNSLAAAETVQGYQASDSVVQHIYAGTSETALDHLENALRLNPRDPLDFEAWSGLAFALIELEREGAAIEAAQRQSVPYNATRKLPRRGAHWPLSPTRSGGLRAFRVAPFTLMGDAPYVVMAATHG